MSKVNFSIHRDNPNSKSTSFAIKLQISNQTDRTIYLKEITPISGDGFELDVYHENHQDLVSEDEKKLCKELTQLLALIQKGAIHQENLEYDKG